jgi:hypothetical protein
MKKLTYLTVMAFVLGIGSSLNAQTTNIDLPTDSEVQNSPIKDLGDMDAPPPPRLLSGGETKLTEISIFPNPSDGILNIKLGQMDGPTLLSIFDVSGRPHFETLLQPLYKSSSQLDLSHLPSGLYLIRVGTETLRFQKI